MGGTQPAVGVGLSICARRLRRKFLDRHDLLANDRVRLLALAEHLLAEPDEHGDIAAQRKVYLLASQRTVYAGSSPFHGGAKTTLKRPLRAT